MIAAPKAVQNVATDERVPDGGLPPPRRRRARFTPNEMSALDAASDEWIAACEAEKAAARNARRRAALASPDATAAVQGRETGIVGVWPGPGDCFAPWRTSPMRMPPMPYCAARWLSTDAGRIRIGSRDRIWLCTRLSRPRTESSRHAASHPGGPRRPVRRGSRPRRPPGPVPPSRRTRSGRQRRRGDALRWNRKTLAGAYDKVGKKDPRWDKPAREALEALARLFGRAVDPAASFEDVYPPAKARR